ncbi:MAG TPA: hypothetical protein VG965_02770 [Patescibacteria group bacterium]|nr:hypothetical protein [Patescibacteria group bacterium]
MKGGEEYMNDMASIREMAADEEDIGDVGKRPTPPDPTPQGSGEKMLANGRKKSDQNRKKSAFGDRNRTEITLDK